MAGSPKLLLGTFVRDDRTEFLEWVAYHRGIGASDIHVFVDRKSLGNRPLLDALEAGGVITLHPVRMDPDIDQEDRNSALRFAALEARETGGFGLYLTRTEYLRINGRSKTVQSLMRSGGGADVMSLAVKVLGFGAQGEHRAGSVMQTERPLARLPFNDPAKVSLRSVVRLGMFGARTPEVPTAPLTDKAPLNWVNGDGEAMPEPHSRVYWNDHAEIVGTSKAEVLRLPAASAETYLLRAAALGPKQRPRPEAVSSDIDALAAAGETDPALADRTDLVAHETEMLLAVPGVSEAMEQLGQMEAEALGSVAANAPELAQFLTTPIPAAPVPERGRRARRRRVAREQAAAPPEQEPAPQSRLLPDWLTEIHMSGDRAGFYTRLDNHAVVCIRRDDARLIVTFDNLSNVNDVSLEREPWAYKFVRDHGYSHLSVMARRKDWYRDPQLIEYLDKLSGDGFFKQFGKVFMAGTSMGGFAALAFASLAPGATVISFNPQTTLDKTLVPWEERFVFGQNRDWSLPHSDCAFEIDDVEKAFVFFDPFFEPDRRHVERLEGDNVVFLKTWCSGHFSPVFLRRANLLKPIMSHAINGTLTPKVFYQMFRERRHLPWYRKSLISNLEERGHMELAKSVVPAFRKIKREAAE